ncbi:glycosyltransferase family 2 protein [Lysinibacillus sp. 3P01SB]|uniref:glycosyltransferase family 2 protein n=1 Tax=Lysinibacillus sp. 3P01SB TaxID=3132284 RepID=UPI0039A40C1A
MKLSIVVPCYNEESVLPMFYEVINSVLQQLNTSYEVVFVNDGSRDKTQNILQMLSEQDHLVKYVSFSKNFGKESAMLAGLSYASGEYVLIMDADLQHPPSLIPAMLAKAEEGYDQVIAKRDRSGEKFTRSFLTRIYYKLINSLVDVRLENGIGDFRLLSRQAVDALLSLKEYNRFSKGLFSWIGFNEAIIEYENITREEGASKWSFASLLNYGIDGVISFNNKPLRIAIYLGLTVTLLDILYVLYMLVQITIKGIDVPGYFTTIAAILLVGGLQLFFMGIIGEYIGRIYYEVKRRPHYIVAKTANFEKEKQREKTY